MNRFSSASSASTLAGALAAVLSGSIIYALIGLVTTMFGVAGLYVYLNSPFLAMMQILIYVGAISVLIAFAVMLVGPLYREPEGVDHPRQIRGGAGRCRWFRLCMFVKFVMESLSDRGKAPAFAMTTKEIGAAVFPDKLMLPFELISLLIVVASWARSCWPFSHGGRTNDRVFSITIFTSTSLSPCFFW